MILEFLKSGIVVFGGCISPVAFAKPRYAVIGHWDADHVPTCKLEILSPMNPPEKIFKYIDPAYRKFFFGESYRVNLSRSEFFTLYPISLKDLRKAGIEKKIHDSRKAGTVPIMLGYGCKKGRTKYHGYVLYIDDFDADDGEAIKKLIDYVALKYGSYFKGVLLPAYEGTMGHKAKHPKELAELSRELLEYAARKCEFVIALAHPSIPHWLYELQSYNVVAFDRDLEVVCDLDEYKKDMEKEEN